MGVRVAVAGVWGAGLVFRRRCGDGKGGGGERGG